MSCPKGFKPSADYVTCVKSYETGVFGDWHYPTGVEKHKIFCMCEDLDESYYDETVDVSFPLLKITYGYVDNLNDFKVTCSKNNSICKFSCKVGSDVKNIKVD